MSSPRIYARARHLVPPRPSHLHSTLRPQRPFSTTRTLRNPPRSRKESFASRLGRAWRRTPITWKPIPIGLGIAFLGVFQFYRVQERERRKQEQEWLIEHDEDGVLRQRKKRQRIRPSGPWSVQIMSTLPLKFLSRLWGKFNELDIPYYLRVPGFKLYGFIFGVNFDEVAEPDLHTYRNLAQFFYRTLKPGVRPLDPHPNALLSPADGRVIQFGYIEHGEVEQVKGVTYSVDALLGAEPTAGGHQLPTSTNPAISPSHPPHRREGGDSDTIRSDEEFARVNGISYTLPNLFSGVKSGPKVDTTQGTPSDQSTSSKAGSEAEVAADLARSPRAPKPWYYPAAKERPSGLYYCVVYLAPGDYHRFHSPVSWVVESRRHFAGELYSVSPYLQRTLPGLFTLNERVCLLGRWKYGFFSYTPVGATNVGSIIINFDRELRTNSLLTDTLADLAAASAQEKGEPYSGYAEATYAGSSPVLGGHALRRGEEMGGFQLGSTIVLLFEAPKGVRPSFDEGWVDPGHAAPGMGDGGRKGGWQWCIEKGMRVKVGEKLGFVEDDDDDDEVKG
ncbi:phosphatidylserine decarboxylase-domain-containing protein [Neohortaea acidophila]|uniref:Phosphatidylserine decarboxylase proenzyme 1, mitochondrial n=1 Tax=Neohortaea acidophila TaxID=245834 RepID=A0A6A6Q128_9PEZI|nr:phosphatidylserine decarboxylase-domain-containing protein [Neohortaea acidophila]KAF2485689.1 phosphatidylserine decarboxylase-domain-containing protein [Neohortaea acidophila]